MSKARNTLGQPLDKYAPVEFAGHTTACLQSFDLLHAAERKRFSFNPYTSCFIK
jgi:hypothetical protein